MSTKTKNNLIRKGIFFGSFGVEFAVAFLCIACNSMICYGVATICGAVLPAFFNQVSKM